MFAAPGWLGIVRDVAVLLAGVKPLQVGLYDAVMRGVALACLAAPRIADNLPTRAWRRIDTERGKVAGGEHLGGDL